MKTTKTVFALVLSTRATAFVAGCGAAPTEAVGDDNEALSAMDDAPSCDPSTTCCVSGGARLLKFGACGHALTAAGCQSYAHAIAHDANGRWWLNTTCPDVPATHDAIARACAPAPYLAYVNSGSACVRPAHPGTLNVTFDPHCPSTCVLR